LPVANGGTNTSTLTANKIMVGNGTSGVLTPTNLHWDNTNSRLGIGTTNPGSKLSIINSASMVNPIAYITFNTENINSVPSNIAAYQIGTQYVVRQNISTGSTNSGYLIGMDFDITTYTNSSGYNGTLAELIGQRFHFGNEKGGDNTPTITNAYGIKLRPFYMNGTISNLYALYIGDDATGGSVTNNFGIYQSTSSAKNYFNGNVGIGTANPTAALHLKAGTATANTAPLKFTSGTNLTTAEAGAMEFNGTNLFFSPSTTRHTVNHGLTGSATLDFPSTTTLLSADLTITVTGAADGDVVSLGVPNAAVNANTCYTAWVSATNTVTVRFNNYSSNTVNPASGTFKVFVTK